MADAQDAAADGAVGRPPTAGDAAGWACMSHDGSECFFPDCACERNASDMVTAAEIPRRLRISEATRAADVVFADDKGHSEIVADCRFIHDFDGAKVAAEIVRRWNAHAELLAALLMMVEEKVDYMRLNHLGDPETQHTIKAGRAALAKAEAA